jgi:hypothetical protein
MTITGTVDRYIEKDDPGSNPAGYKEVENYVVNCT